MNQDPAPSSFVRADRDKKTLLILVLLALFACAAVYCVYMWKQNSDLRASLEGENTKNQALAEQNDHLKNARSDTTTDQKTISQTIGDKKITYPLDENTERLLLWQNPDGSVEISHKDVLMFLTELPVTTRQALCGNGAYATTNDISMGKFDPGKATYAKQDANCLRTLASERNTNVALRAEATALETAITQSLEDFVADLKVE